jgi:hypothetical protein
MTLTQASIYRFWLPLWYLRWRSVQGTLMTLTQASIHRFSLPESVYIEACVNVISVPCTLRHRRYQRGNQNLCIEACVNVIKERWWHWPKLRYIDSDYPFGVSGDVVYKERWWHWHKLRDTHSDYTFGITGDVVYKERWWHWHKLHIYTCFPTMRTRRWCN